VSVVKSHWELTIILSLPLLYLLYAYKYLLRADMFKVILPQVTIVPQTLSL